MTLWEIFEIVWPFAFLLALPFSIVETMEDFLGDKGNEKDDYSKRESDSNERG